MFGDVLISRDKLDKGTVIGPADKLQTRNYVDDIIALDWSEQKRKLYRNKQYA